MKNTMLVLVVAVMSGTVQAQNCGYEKLKVGHNRAKQALIAEAHGYRFDFLGAEPRDGKVAEGPFKIYQGANKFICQVDTGIFEDEAYYSHSKKLVILSTYSGSEAEYRVYDTRTCKEVGKMAHYYGKPILDLKRSKLVIDSSREETEKDGKPVAACMPAQVFYLDPKTCAFVLNEKESDALTKEQLGQTLPFNKISYITPKPVNICDGVHEVYELTEEFEKTGKAKDAEQIIATVKKLRADPKAEKCEYYQDIYKYLEQHKNTTKRALKGDSVAIHYLFSQYGIADGAAAEELDIDLGNTIVKYPRIFLQNLKATQGEKFCSTSLMTNDGDTDVDKGITKKNLQARQRALQSVKDPKLAKVRDLCVQVIHKELKQYGSDK